MSATAPIVAISGASSFTGLWIARAFQADGWTVHAVCPRQELEYQGLRAIRVRLLRQSVHVHFGIRAEDNGLSNWLRVMHPAVWVHHHHWMESFRSPAYDLERARRVSLDPLPDLVAALAVTPAAGVIYSGTFFEPGEGGTNPNDEATPYGRSKRAVWLRLQDLAATTGLRASKVVIPNPIGPLENEDRFVPLLIRASVRGERFMLHTPGTVSDYLPVSLLAQRYVAVARDLLNGAAQIRRPSGRASSARDWAVFVLSELVSRRLGLAPCPLDLGDPAVSATSFRNPEPASPAIDWNEVWDDYAAWIQALHPPRP